MTNKEFFIGCLQNELKATYDIIAALPFDKISYKPHEINRSAYEIAEHIIAHALDFNVILNNNTCDECLVMPFTSSQDGADQLKEQWEKAISTLTTYSDSKWNEEPVELLVAGNPILTMPRANLMWFFLFDVIHHRGQLSSYIRPMGGKNPAVYGYSADTMQ
ncbi:MAG: DinB family protein [Bacteroidota bacterium]|jgi:uncharacterized damage-inducible protein DinB